MIFLIMDELSFAIIQTGHHSGGIEGLEAYFL
jgi:hypothetical protein